MAQSFRTSDAKEMNSLYTGLMAELGRTLSAEGSLRQLIKEAADRAVWGELSKILRDIPVEELNRGKQGIRVKTLRENGYSSILDIIQAPAVRLAQVKGISDEGARLIGAIAREIADGEREGVKLRLSADDRNPASTGLVRAISEYRLYQRKAARAAELLDSVGPSVNAALNDLRPATGGVRWLLASSQTKDKASGAFDYLSRLTADGFTREARELINTVRSLGSGGRNTAARSASGAAPVRARGAGRYGPRGSIQNGVQASGSTGSVAGQFALTDEEVWQDFVNAPIPFMNIIESAAPGVLGSNDTNYGLPADLAEAVQAEPFYPEGLGCTLRPYQEVGVKYILHQGRVLLGDEMGLGKTVQALAVMVSLRNTGATHFMVVCPASVLTNWCREVTDKTDLVPVKVHGDDRLEAFAEWTKNGGVCVTTYETTDFLEPEEAFRFDLLVVDEAHYIKNPGAARTRNVKRIAEHAERILFMTGTALENRVDEMIELTGDLRPEIARELAGLSVLPSAPRFREAVAPVYYRRRRADVLTELPEKTETIEWCTLLPAEKRAYERSVLSRNFAEARRVSWMMEDLDESSKARRLAEIVEEAAEDGRKILVFSFFLDTLSKVSRLLGDRCMEQINGSVPPQRRQEIIDEFEKAPAGAVLPAQIQSGGTGLNIQSASVVVLCEPQLKPSTENQAISRAYRMGQTRNVLVYRLLADDTIDERLILLLAEKQDIFDAFADESVAADKTADVKTSAEMAAEAQASPDGAPGAAPGATGPGAAAQEAAAENTEIDEKTLRSLFEREVQRITEQNAAPVQPGDQQEI